MSDRKGIPLPLAKIAKAAKILRQKHAQCIQFLILNSSFLIGIPGPFVEPRWGSVIGVIGNPACAARHWALEFNAIGVKASW